MQIWSPWQLPYQHGTFVILPPEPVRQMVNELRQKYDPVSQFYCEAHISLTQPFLQKPTEKDWEQIERIISDFASFQIDYGPVNTFLPRPVIYFEIQPAEKLVQIVKALHESGLFNLASKYATDFTPHMTIAEGLSETKIDQELFEYLAKHIISGSFFCQKISFIVPDVQFHFNVKKNIFL